MSDWKERNVTTYIDLGKISDEIAFYRKHGMIQPLRSRKLIFHDMEDDEVLTYLESFRDSEYLSLDIESVYPRKGSAYYKLHPGYPITLGIAPSAELGISFNLFRKTPAGSAAVWKKLDKIQSEAKIIGQNFFNFDALFLSALGFSMCPERFYDTLLRSHILWPELPRRLDFLTRQYTRQPFYKDSGKQWSTKDMSGLRKYNCLDVCCTYEVFEAQEAEFKQRPHLKGAA
jgi:hypothetical protein